MDFKRLKTLPFRKAKIGGVERYVADLGDMRIFVDDVNLLTTGTVKTTDPYTGTDLYHEYSLPLPADGVALVVNLEGEHIIQATVNSVVIAGQQVSGFRLRVGSITNVTPSSMPVEHTSEIYQVYQRTRSGKLSRLEGVVITDEFAEEIPYSYAHTVEHYDETDLSTTISVLRYGELSDKRDRAMFVAESEQEMLSHDVKRSDRCYRIDQNEIYVNISGTNESMADWKNLAPEDIEAVKSEFDQKMEDQKNELTGLIVGLG